MISKRIRILLLLFFSFVAIPLCDNAERSLLHFGHQGASVLPIFNKDGMKYVLLSREAGGRDKGTYDDWGGSADQDETPLLTAARECSEEIISHRTMGKDVASMMEYIDPVHRHTKYVIAFDNGRSKYVTYITSFHHYINGIQDRFYAARAQEKEWKYREKDRLALVPWNALKNAIRSNPKSTDFKVQADVVNPGTLELEPEEIILRPFLVIKLRGFFENKPYIKGQLRKIRFYS